MVEQVINKTSLAIKQITTPRYYRTERGFVSEFYKELSRQFENDNPFPNHTILESEVQKSSAKHYGINQRPDILIHIPIETGLTTNANENNFVVYAFKLNGAQSKAVEDFDKLDQMFNLLNYEIGIFINISSYPTSYLNKYQGQFRDRIHEFSIALAGGQVLINHTHFVGHILTTTAL